MATLIDTGGGQQEVSVSCLEDMQEHVGGLVEIVGHYEGRTVLADEEGLLKQELQVNVWASMAIDRIIMGRVLLVTEPDEFN